MNERIKQLILKAGWKNAYTDPKAGFEPVFEGEERNLACIEKFAELIIRECLGDHKERIATRYQGSDYDRAVGYGMEIVYYDIVEKFRVE